MELTLVEGTKREDLKGLELQATAEHNPVLLFNEQMNRWLAGVRVFSRGDNNDFAASNIATEDAYNIFKKKNTFEAGIEFKDGEGFRTRAFMEGLLGSGMALEKVNGKYVLTADSLVIRETLTVLEFIIQQVRAHNGDLIISDTGSGRIKTFNKAVG